VLWRWSCNLTVCWGCYVHTQHVCGQVAGGMCSRMGGGALPTHTYTHNNMTEA